MAWLQTVCQRQALGKNDTSNQFTNELQHTQFLELYMASIGRQVSDVIVNNI